MLKRLTTRDIANTVKFFRPFTTTEQIYSARPSIKHYVISRGKNANNDSILNEIKAVIKSSKDSIVFLTQKSRVVVTHYFDPSHPGRPATEDEIKKSIHEQSFKSILERKSVIPLFQPEPGHICLVLTDISGEIEEKNTVSLTPIMKERLLEGKTDLHVGLYGSRTGGIYKSTQTTFNAEAEKLARAVSNPNSTVVADIIVVPFSTSEVSRAQLVRNIDKAKTTPIYNLCKTIFKQKIIQNSGDITIEKFLNEMRHVADLSNLRHIDMRHSDELILAAFACTNAAVEACFGDPHYLARNVRLDLSTQSTVTLCCSMSLIGEHEFFEFARNFGFYDNATALLEKLDDDKITPSKR